MPGYPVKLVTRCGCERLVMLTELLPVYRVPLTHRLRFVADGATGIRLNVPSNDTREFELVNIDIYGHHVYREVE